MFLEIFSLISPTVKLFFLRVFYVVTAELSVLHGALQLSVRFWSYKSNTTGDSDRTLIGGIHAGKAPVSWVAKTEELCGPTGALRGLRLA